MGTTHPSQLAASDARFRILWSSLLLVPPPASPPAVPAHLILAVLEARPLDLPRAAVGVLAPGGRGREVHPRQRLPRLLVEEQPPLGRAVRLYP